jgi:hypothetical protein
VPIKWNGRCFVHHGGQQFPQWWKSNRGAGEPVKLNSSELDVNDYLLWDVAVFIRDDMIPSNIFAMLTWGILAVSQIIIVRSMICC